MCINVSKQKLSILLWVEIQAMLIHYSIECLQHLYYILVRKMREELSMFQIGRYAHLKLKKTTSASNQLQWKKTCQDLIVTLTTQLRIGNRAIVITRKLPSACGAPNHKQTSLIFFVGENLSKAGCSSIKSEGVVDSEKLREIDNANVTVRYVYFSTKVCFALSIE